MLAKTRNGAQKLQANEREASLGRLSAYVHVQVQARLTESSVFQVRKFQLRAYLCVTCSLSNVGGGRGFRKVRDEVTRNRLGRVSTSLSRVALVVVWCSLRMASGRLSQLVAEYRTQSQIDCLRCCRRCRYETNERGEVLADQPPFEAGYYVGTAVSRVFCVGPGPSETQ